MLPASWLNWLRRGSASGPSCSMGAFESARGDAQSNSANSRTTPARRTTLIGLFWHKAGSGGDSRRRG